MNCTSVSNVAYVPGSFERHATVKWDSVVANFAEGITAIYLSLDVASGTGGNSLGAYQMSFDPPIPKTSAFSFYITTVLTWGRGE